MGGGKTYQMEQLIFREHTPRDPEWQIKLYAIEKGHVPIVLGGWVAELSSSRLSCLYIPPFSPGVGLRGAPSEGKGETIRGEPYVATT